MLSHPTTTVAQDSEVRTDGGEDESENETGTVATRNPHLTVRVGTGD